MRRASFFAVVALVVQLIPTPVSAATWVGTCELTLTFTFSSNVKATGTAPSYTITAAPAPGVDYNPVNWAGQQPCAVTPDAADPARTTTVTSGGSSSFWTCSTVLSSGTWAQTFRDIFGGFTPDDVGQGNHVLSGSWGEWVLESEDGDAFASVIELTVHPDDAGKLQTCNTTGFNKLRMVGIQSFTDD